MKGKIIRLGFLRLAPLKDLFLNQETELGLSLDELKVFSSQIGHRGLAPLFAS